MTKQQDMLFTGEIFFFFCRIWDYPRKQYDFFHQNKETDTKQMVSVNKHYYFANISFTRVTTFPTENPNSSIILPPGADAPK